MVSQSENNSSIQTLVNDLLTQAENDQQRRCLVLAGEADWASNSTQTLLEIFPGKRIRWVSKRTPDNFTHIESDKRQTILGEETDMIVFDAFSGFNPDIFGAVCGTICAGGLLILLCPPLSEWADFHDPEYERITVFPIPASEVSGRFLARTAKVILNHKRTIVQEQGKSIPAIESSAEKNPAENKMLPTQDQLKAVEAIIKVAIGRRRRPLVITSNRGRGKSAALGIAAAQLMQQGVDQIITTAPRQDAAGILFKHAAALLNGADCTRGVLKTGSAVLQFLPPDELIRHEHPAGLLLVDEAAAIPAPLLEQLLTRYSRIVFASTIHGYEGTGRGFAVRFNKTLNELTPHWKALEMKTPIRWTENDPLEDLVFKLLLLDAEPARGAEIQHATKKNSHFEQIDRQQLLKDESSLGEIFGLLINAHYQTRPSDVRYLLDGPNLSVFVLRRNTHIIATMLIANEGGFDEKMAQEIVRGKRRPHGHLIPETLASHVGLKQAPQLKGARIVRIAVHPALQRKGLGSCLLDQLQDHPVIKHLDYLAACFGATTDLLRFWKNNEYLPVRVGIQRNASSGEHSAVVFKPLSQSGAELFSIARSRFFRQLPHQLSDPLQDLEPDLAAFLLIQEQKIKPALDEMDWEDIRAFIHNERIYEACPAPLWAFTCAALMDKDLSTLLSGIQRNVLISKVIQKKHWQQIAKSSGLSGRREVREILQEGLHILLKQLFDK